MKPTSAAAAALCASLCAILILDLTQLAGSGHGLRELVLEHLPHSGVRSPVTAILLNFRGYDTLLEIAVLTVAAWAVWTLPRGADPVRALRAERRDGTLDLLVGLLVPAAILVGGYLLWVGAHAPGGAFQAGAVLAAGCVLILVSGTDGLSVRSLGRQTHFAERALLVAGLAVFTLAGTWGPLNGRNFLGFVPAAAGYWIFAIELASAVSIALILTALFAGRPLGADERGRGP